MKRVLIFIGLKIAEIVGAIAMLFIGQKVPLYLWPEQTIEHGFWEFWLVDGGFGILMIFLAVLVPIVICWLFWELLKKNWQTAKRIAEK